MSQLRNRIRYQTEQEAKAKATILNQKETIAQLEKEAKERMNEMERQWLASQKEERSNERRIKVEKLAFKLKKTNM